MDWTDYVMFTVLAGVVAMGVFGQSQEPTPLPGHGPYYGREGWGCWRSPDGKLYLGKDKKTGKEKTRNMVQCSCKAPCDDFGTMLPEDSACKTYCQQSSKDPQCVCHADECGR